MRFAVVFDTKDQADFIPHVVSTLNEIGEASTIMSEQIMDGILSTFDAVIFPGSFGSWYGLMKYKDEFVHTIRYYVDAGCGYLGVCGGAYIAGREPASIVRPTCNLTLGLAEVKVEFPPAILTLAMYAYSQWHTYPIFIQFVDNPVIPGHKEIVQIAYNSGPLMSEPGGKVIPIANFVQVGFEGKLAIIATTFGQGRVILCSPHPESSFKGDKEPSVPWLYPQLARWVAEREIKVMPQPLSLLPMFPWEGLPLPRFLGARWKREEVEFLAFTKAGK